MVNGGKLYDYNRFDTRGYMYTVTRCFCVVVKWSQVKGQNQYVWCVIAVEVK